MPPSSSASRYRPEGGSHDHRRGPRQLPRQPARPQVQPPDHSLVQRHPGAIPAGPPPPVPPGAPEDIEDFLGAIKGSAETHHAYYRALRAFCHFTAARFHLPNPMESVRIPQPKPRPPRTLSLPELGCLLAAPLSRRDRALITLLADTGIRVSEAASLDDQALAPEIIQVDGKTGPREVPISEETYRQLQALIEEKGPGPLFTSEITGKPLTRSGLYRAVRCALARAGIAGRRCGPHALRHTFGRQYIAAGGDIFSLQRIFGHSTLTMVKRYVDLDLGDTIPPACPLFPTKTGPQCRPGPFLGHGRALKTSFSDKNFPGTTQPPGKIKPKTREDSAMSRRETITQQLRRKAEQSTRGGRRPGAGAPPGNLNALKHGRYSKKLSVMRMSSASRSASDRARDSRISDGMRREA